MLGTFDLLDQKEVKYGQRRAEDFFQIGQNKKIGGGRIRFCPPPPAEFDSDPGAEQTTGGGAENLIIPRERGRNV